MALSLHENLTKHIEIAVGAHSCAMNSRLKAAPTINISEREILRLSKNLREKAVTIRFAGQRTLFLDTRNGLPL